MSLTFILSLAHAPNGVDAYVHAFVLAEDPEALAGLLKAELAALRGGDEDCRGVDFVARVGRWLDAVDGMLRPADPAAALALLARFVEAAECIEAHCWDDDFGAAEATARARALLGDVNRQLPAQGRARPLPNLADCSKDG